jgi:hypothetical protein
MMNILFNLIFIIKFRFITYRINKVVVFILIFLSKQLISSTFFILYDLFLFSSLPLSTIIIFYQIPIFSIHYHFHFTYLKNLLSCNPYYAFYPFFHSLIITKLDFIVVKYLGLFLIFIFLTFFIFYVSYFIF